MADQSTARHPALLCRERALLLIVDIQERLAAVMPRRDETVAAAVLLARASRALGVPILLSEQYRKGLGPTVPEVGDALAGAAEPIEKQEFSCVLAPPIREAISARPERDQILVVGMEAHVCVYQTVLDLLHIGRQVHVAADAVCSRFDRDAEAALRSMAAAGAAVTTAESAVFQLLVRAGTPEFKAVLPLVKQRTG